MTVRIMITYKDNEYESERFETPQVGTAIQSAHMLHQTLNTRARVQIRLMPEGKPSEGIWFDIFDTAMIGAPAANKILRPQ